MDCYISRIDMARASIGPMGSSSWFPGEFSRNFSTFYDILCVFALEALAWHSVAELEAASLLHLLKIKTSLDLFGFCMYPGGSSSWRPFGRRQPQERCHCLSSSKTQISTYSCTADSVSGIIPSLHGGLRSLPHSNMSNLRIQPGVFFSSHVRHLALAVCIVDHCRVSDKVWALRLGEHRPQTSQCHFLKNTLKGHIIINDSNI